MEKILIIGAFDRYNYGDLLFPLIIEKQLDTYGQDFKYEFFGIVQSDLSALGGKPTADLQAFYRECNRPGQNVHIIIAGGEALGVSWNSLLAALNKPFQKVHKHHVKVSKVLDLNLLSKWLLKGKTTLPFVFDKKDFSSVKTVIMNSLGGSGITPALFARYPWMRPKLQQADYLAVRDRVTLANLKENGVDAMLFPDSAILMSEFYTMEVLEKGVTMDVRNFVRQDRGKYLFFQINRKTTVGKEALIASELDKIYEDSGLALCLCPIGKALNHDDHEALHAVRARLKSPSTYFDADNIWDIMYLIANSAIYIGTSLHGAITALSFEVPHVGLVTEKLDAYLGTWGVKDNQFAVGFDKIYEQYKVAVAVAPGELARSKNHQFVEIKKAFYLIAREVSPGQPAL